MRTKTRKATPITKNTLGLQGKIYNRDGIEVGDYRYSLYNGSYSFSINDCSPHHFWHAEELLQFLQEHGYSYIAQ